MTDSNQGSQEHRPPEFYGITEQDFNSWKHHPVTKAFYRFIEEQRDALKEDALLRWQSGSMDETFDAETRGECNTLTALLDLSFENMRQLSGITEEEENDGTESI